MDKAIKHGLSGYQYDRCRCDICKSAKSEHSKRHKEKMLKHFAETGDFLSDRVKHGERTAYVNYGCRCELCRAENTQKTLRSRYKQRAKKLAAAQ